MAAVQIESIDAEIEEVKREIKNGHYAAAVEVQFYAALAELEKAKALARIADRLEQGDWLPGRR